MSMSIEECKASRLARPTPSIANNVLDQFKLSNKVAAVTGAADGIGYAVAEGYAEAGAHVALIYNSNEAAVEKAKQLAATHNIQARAYKLDVTDPSAVEKTLAQIVADYGRLDIMVANAGTANSKPVLEMSVAEYRALMATNLDGVFYCAKFAGAIFQRQGAGVLILTSSISAHIVNVPVDQPVYNASKAAVSHLGRSLAREWREFARVNIVSPGFFNTKMGASPLVVNEAHRMAVLGRQGDVKEIKGLFVYLASDASSYMTGHDAVIDGGYTLP